MDLTPRVFLALAVLSLFVLLYVLFDLFKLKPHVTALGHAIGRMISGAAASLRSAGRRVKVAFNRTRTRSPAGPDSPVSAVVAGTINRASPGPGPGAGPGAGSPTFSLRGQIADLEAANESVGRRNRYLLATFLAGLLLLLMVLWGVYRNEVLSYAIIDHLSVTRDPVNEGRFKISFEVASPGKVLYRRTSGNIETEVVDFFRTEGKYERTWGWVYEPGRDTHVSLTYRSGMWRAGKSEVFPTSDSADIVILIDTTGSMSRSIAQLKEKCVSFSSQLNKQHLKHRFALIGFGDRAEGSWLDEHPFTEDVERFRRDVEAIRRFDGGDFPESALDALEEALSLPFNKGAIRRFYLVTDAGFHEPTQAGTHAVGIGARLEKEKVLLHVFSSPESQGQYATLLGTSGKFQELASFGEVLAEGRVLED